MQIMDIHKINQSFSKSKEAMHLVVEISLGILETGDKVASGSFISQLKDFADELFDVTFSEVDEEGRKVLMEQANKMNWKVKDENTTRKQESG